MNTDHRGSVSYLHEDVPQTDRWVWGWSLTDTQVWRWFEAVGADAAVTTHHINTLTRTTDVWILSTLITIWEEESNIIIIIITHYEQCEIFPLHTHSPTHCWVGVCRYPGLHSQRKLPGTFRQTAFCWHTGPFWHSSISAHTSFTKSIILFNLHRLSQTLSHFLFVIADFTLQRGVTWTLIW